MILLGLIWYLLHNSFFPLYKISNEILISCKMCFFNESFQFRHRKQTVHKQWWSFYCKRLYMPHTCNTYKAYMNLFFFCPFTGQWEHILCWAHASHANTTIHRNTRTVGTYLQKSTSHWPLYLGLHTKQYYKQLWVWYGVIGHYFNHYNMVIFEVVFRMIPFYFVGPKNDDK